jgi:hypothetical protein
MRARGADPTIRLRARIAINSAVGLSPSWPPLAPAILDRLLHHSHTLMIQGERYRLKHKKKAGFFAAATQHGRPEPRADA